MTVEEKAGMYAAKTEADFGFDMHPKTASFQGFIDGYAEAMRWRDPKEKLPDEAGCDFCRDEQGYTIGNMYVCDKCGRQIP